MKVICSKEVLLKEISIAQEIIATKNVISILSNIYMETGEDSLIIRATDMKVFFETTVPVNVVEPGSTTVFGDKFLGIISIFPYDDIEFYVKDNNVIVKPSSEKKPEYKLKSITSDKFPEFSVSTASHFEFYMKDFRDMIKQSIFSVSDDETRYYMNGVFLEKAEGTLNMVATDGRRLSFVGKKASSKIPDFAGIIIPPKILNTLYKRSNDEGLISVSVSDKMIYIEYASYKFSSVLIEGSFPNYRRVIPENQAFSLTVKREEMLNALHRVALIVEKKSHRIYLNISSEKVAVYSEESEIGTVEDEITCQYDGEDITIALNYRYLEDPFRVMEASEVKILFNNATKAITIEPVPKEDFFHIVMPMQS
jgi:DNA polymerase-3 subunit beta